MKLTVLNIFISCFLIIKPCLCLEETSSNPFLCPDSSETSLVTAVVSGCKVYYTCKNAVVTKIFQCSDSPMLAGTTHVCQENPQCPGIDSFEEMMNLPANIKSKVSESVASVIATNGEEISTNFTDTIVGFIKCLVNVDSIDEFCKTCIDSTLFQKKRFMEIELSPKVFEVYAKMLNNSNIAAGGSNPTLYKSFGKELKDFLRYLNPQCEIVCKDASKPQHSSGDKSQDEPLIPFEDLKQSFDDGYDQILSGDRFRRSPTDGFSLLRSALASYQRQLTLRTPKPPTTPTIVEKVVNDNKTLMSDIILPMVKDLVNDEEALKNTTNIVRIVFEALVPLATETLKASSDSFDLDKKAILRIPRKMVQDAIQKIYADAVPILRSTLRSKMPFLLMVLSKNTRLMFRSWDEMHSRLEPNMQKLISRFYELYSKYYRMYATSSSDFIHTYSIIEIQQDIESLYSILPDVSRELLIKNLSVFQDVSGINTENISKLLLDVPGIFDVIDEIPFEQYVYFALLLF